MKKEGGDIPFPGWEAVEAEQRQEDPAIWLTVKDSDNNVVRRIKGAAKKGFHRIAWDLRFPATSVIDATAEPTERQPIGIMSLPGTYSVILSKVVDGQSTDLAGPVEFKVERLRQGSLEGSTLEAVEAFWKDLAGFQRQTTAASLCLRKALKRVDALKTALARTPSAPGQLDHDLHAIRKALMDMEQQLAGSRSRRQIGEKNNPTIGSRLSAAMSGTMSSTYGPTPTHQRTLEIAKSEFSVFKTLMQKILQEDVPAFEKAMQDAGAPFVK